MEVTLLNVVSYAAILFTIASFLAGVEVCLSIWRRKSTVDVPCLPLLAGFLCTALWLQYSLYAKDPFMAFVNAVGFLCFAFYVVFYYYFCPNKRMLSRKLGFCLILFTLLYVAGNTQENPKNFAGFSASTAGVFFMASPMAAALEVVQTKSTEKLPFLLILSSFLVGSAWYWYGILMQDPFVQVPNGIGALVSGAQLLLFVVYPRRSQKAVSLEKAVFKIGLLFQLKLKLIFGILCLTQFEQFEFVQKKGRHSSFTRISIAGSKVSLLID